MMLMPVDAAALRQEHEHVGVCLRTVADRARLADVRRKTVADPMMGLDEVPDARVPDRGARLGNQHRKISFLHERVGP